MDDTIVIKPVATVTLDTTGISFPRIRSETADKLRRYYDELYSSILRIAHQLPNAKRTKQRSLVALDTERSRIDASAIVIRTDKSTLALQITRDPLTTNAEIVNDFKNLVGALSETRNSVAFALLNAVLNGEE